MQTTLTISFLAIAGASALAAILTDRDDTPADILSVDRDDPVVASFARKLNREPAPPAPAQRSKIYDDELYRLVNTPHWTDSTPDDETGSQNQSDTDEDPGSSPGAKNTEE